MALSLGSKYLPGHHSESKNLWFNYDQSRSEEILQAEMNEGVAYGYKYHSVKAH